MSTAIRCDRCGAAFSPRDLPDHVKFGQIYGHKVFSRASYRNNAFIMDNDNIDFCPECTSDFEHFMQGYEMFPTCQSCIYEGHDMGSDRCAACMAAYPERANYEPRKKDRGDDEKDGV